MSQHVTFKHPLGSKVRERVSGFEGIITGNVIYLNGCKQCLVRPKIDPNKPHEVPEGHWFDEDYLEMINTVDHHVEPRNTGSDTEAPTAPSHG